MEKHSFKRKLEGIVVADSNDKTVVVKVLRRFKHGKYSKFVNETKKYHAHDVSNKYKSGDSVTIVESKAYSKQKKWEVL
jgi:small subunit ribosomal protein S17